MKAVELRKKTCCFTGHRDIPIDRTQEIAKRTANEIRRLIVNRGVCFFGVGGAIGYDMLAARVLFRLRETEFPNIKVILVYPFDGFTDRMYIDCAIPPSSLRRREVVYSPKGNWETPTTLCSLLD